MNLNAGGASRRTSRSSLRMSWPTRWTSGIDFPYWLDRPARLRIVAACRVAAVPEELLTPWPPPGEMDEAEFVAAWRCWRHAGVARSYANLNPRTEAKSAV